MEVLVYLTNFLEIDVLLLPLERRMMANHCLQIYRPIKPGTRIEASPHFGVSGSIVNNCRELSSHHYKSGTSPNSTFSNEEIDMRKEGKGGSEDSPSMVSKSRGKRVRTADHG